MARQVAGTKRLVELLLLEGFPASTVLRGVGRLWRTSTYHTTKFRLSQDLDCGGVIDRPENRDDFAATR